MSRFARACGLVAVGLVVAAVASSPAGAYGWPVRPFDRPHPVRGNFGDPRFGARGFFHFGIDISAPDGTPVYATISGQVYRKANQPEVVGVTSADGVSLEYWHVNPAVVPGQQVVAYQTVLGRIVRWAGHVHLSEVRGGVYVNPLRRGALAPYGDRKRPTIAGVLVTRAGRAIPLDSVSGRVDVIVNAFDTPSLRPPPPWGNKPVTPAVVHWRVVRGGRAVMPWTSAIDFTRNLPPPETFAGVYAPGTRQNRSHRAGRYRFFLARAWDTGRLRPGSYRLDVVASDIRGNRAVASLPFTVLR